MQPLKKDGPCIDEIFEIPFLSDLPPEVSEDLRNELIVKTFQPDEFLYEKGHISNELFFVLKGVVEISSLSQDGREYIFSTHTTKSFCGDLGFLDGKPRESNARARTHVETIILKRAHLISIIDKIPFLSWLNLLYHLCESNRALTKHLENLSFLSPEERLYTKLIELCDKSSKKTDPYLLYISQEQLANMVGITRESVSKHLTKLEKDSILSKSRGSITVNNVARLRECLEGNFDD